MISKQVSYTCHICNDTFYDAVNGNVELSLIQHAKHSKKHKNIINCSSRSSTRTSEIPILCSEIQSETIWSSSITQAERQARVESEKFLCQMNPIQICKNFAEKGIVQGTVQSFRWDSKHKGLYTIMFVDGDKEDLSIEELLACIKMFKDNRDEFDIGEN